MRFAQAVTVVISLLCLEAAAQVYTCTNVGTNLVGTPCTFAAAPAPDCALWPVPGTIPAEIMVSVEFDHDTPNDCIQLTAVARDAVPTDLVTVDLFAVGEFSSTARPFALSFLDSARTAMPVNGGIKTVTYKLPAARLLGSLLAATAWTNIAFIASSTCTGTPATNTITSIIVSDGCTVVYPTMTDDAVTFLDDPPNVFSGDLLTNDACSVAPCTLARVTDGTSGSFTITSTLTGAFSYTPTSADIDPASDTFTYRLTDASGTVATTTATVTITRNKRPIAVDDTGIVLGPASPGSVTGPDVRTYGTGDIDDKAVTLLTTKVGTAAGDNVQQPGSALTLNTAGTWTYTYNEIVTANGPASFTDGFYYTLNDGNRDSTNKGHVTFTVKYNRPPSAGDDEYQLPAPARQLDVAAPGVRANDNDLDTGDTLTLTVVSAPAKGTLTLNNDGSFSYVPDKGDNTGTQFTYKISDGTYSATAKVVIKPGTCPNAHSRLTNMNNPDWFKQ